VSNVLVISRQKARTLAELVTRPRPVPSVDASAGVGSEPIGGRTPAAQRRVPRLHVPFRVSGRPHGIMTAARLHVRRHVVALGFIRQGTLLPLAVCTPKRTAALPKLLTDLSNRVAPNSDYTFWTACWCRRRTHADIVDRLHRKWQKFRSPCRHGKSCPSRHRNRSPLLPAEFDAAEQRKSHINIALRPAAASKFNGPLQVT